LKFLKIQIKIDETEKTFINDLVIISYLIKISILKIISNEKLDKKLIIHFLKIHFHIFFTFIIFLINEFLNIIQFENNSIL